MSAALTIGCRLRVRGLSLTALWPTDSGMGADQALSGLGNNLGTLTPKHQVKRGSRADQKAERINKIDVPALSAKPPSPVQIRAAPPNSLKKIAKRAQAETGERPILFPNCRRHEQEY